MIAETEPDCTVILLNEEVHDDIARLLGIDHAISDYIFLHAASFWDRRTSKDAPSDRGGARPCYRRRKGSHG